MSITALSPDYEAHTEIRDRVENFAGDIQIFVHWGKHLSFCAPLAFRTAPSMPFGEFLSAMVLPVYNLHPEAAAIDWEKAEWLLDGEARAPNFAKSLVENGLHHKSVMRFRILGLDGYKGSAS